MGKLAESVSEPGRNSNNHKVNTFTYEPRREKTGLQGFRPGATQIGLYSQTNRLEAGNFGYK